MLNLLNTLKGALPVLILALQILLTPIPGGAQVAGGTISGTITDKSGAVIPNAQISLHDLATNSIKTTMTNAQGPYSAPNLLPGQYEVTATAPHFSTSIASGITLTVGAELEINLSLGRPCSRASRPFILR